SRALVATAATSTAAGRAGRLHVQTASVTLLAVRTAWSGGGADQVGGFRLLGRNGRLRCLPGGQEQGGDDRPGESDGRRDQDRHAHRAGEGAVRGGRQWPSGRADPVGDRVRRPHPRRVARAASPPTRRPHSAASTLPSTATPSAPPTWRTVSFIADPTPALAGGSVAMIESVAGTMASPIPRPCSTRNVATRP